MNEMSKWAFDRKVVEKTTPTSDPSNNLLTERRQYGTRRFSEALRSDSILFVSRVSRLCFEVGV